MLNTQTKVLRVLSAFMSGEKHTRFTAERELHDHCLNSTVSELQRDYGVKISRKFITVPGYMSSSTRCCLYWMDSEEIMKHISIKTTGGGEKPQGQRVTI